MKSTLVLLQPEQSLLTWSQVALGVLLIFVIGGIALLMIRTGVGNKTLSKEERSWLDYGNLYVVVLGLGAVTIGFLFILLFLDRFSDMAQALGFLTALFGAIVGLVGTYFGVKNSADAREGAEKVALTTSATSTVPTVTIAPAAAPVDPASPLAVGDEHTVSASVVSVDGSPASNMPVTFTITAGPDVGVMGVSVTDVLGQATFTFTNNSTAGTDTIEAAALGGSGTATATFT